MDRKVDITDASKDMHIQFSYSVEWYEEPNLLWKNRMTRYAESRFLPSSFEIHWLSIINSFVLVLLLTAFLTIILLRVLKNDFSRFMELDDDGMEEEEVSCFVVREAMARGVCLCADRSLLVLFPGMAHP
jgi:Endomembrane protein 70